MTCARIAWGAGRLEAGDGPPALPLGALRLAAVGGSNPGDSTGRHQQVGPAAVCTRSVMRHGREPLVRVTKGMRTGRVGDGWWAQIEPAHG